MPTKTLSDLRAIMSGLIADEAGKLSLTTRNQAIQAAVKLHSNNIPAIKFQVVTGVSDDTATTPTGWVDEVSEIIAIELPLNDRPPTYLEEDEFRVIAAATASTAYRIVFIYDVPGATERFGVRFTAPHKLGATASQNTIPDHHLDAVAHLAASVACNQLAAFYSQSADSMIQADSVNPQQKNPNYLQLSKAYKTYYLEFFKIDEKGFARAATVILDVDRKFQFGTDFFYHNRKWR